MTKEFEKIKSEVEKFRNDVEIQQRKREENDRQEKQQSFIKVEIERKKAMSKLEQSGIKRLFEEIRDSGLVKLNNKPAYKTIPVYRQKFFGGQVFDHDEYQKQSDYTPAYITEGVFYEENHNEYFACVAISFDEREYDAGEGDFGHDYSQIRIGFLGNQLCLCQHEERPNSYRSYLPPERKVVYKPIEINALETILIESIKKPPLTRAQLKLPT